MGNPLEEIAALDVTIDSAALEAACIEAQINPRIRQNIEENECHLEDTIAHYASLLDKGTGNAITIREYLCRNIHIIREHRKRKVRRWGTAWEEESRISNGHEREFCAQARRVAKGRFTEVLQGIYIRADNTAQKYLAFSGKATGVDEEDILRALAPQQHTDLKLVVLVHNHPDLLRDSKVFAERSGETIGLIATNGLSRADIDFTDRFYKQFGGEVPVVMMAISEDGLTHTYIAGTATKYSLSKT